MSAMVRRYDLAMVNHPLRFLILMVAGWVNRKQLDVIAYLQKENHVLRQQLGGKRRRFTDDQRRRLATRDVPI